MSQKPQNIKISARAWELLRWAKLNLKTQFQIKSYSDTIQVMENQISTKRSGLLKKSLQDFNADIHRIKFKTPKDGALSTNQSTKPKTILLDPKAHRILERIKIESNLPAYTFSDAIEFLVKENNLMPDHLKE